MSWPFLVVMVVLLGGMMLFSSRSKRKQAEQAKKLSESMVPGTDVMTTSGLHGTVTAIGDGTIELEIAPGIYTTWARAAVREVVKPVAAELDGPESDEPDAADHDTVDALDDGFDADRYEAEFADRDLHAEETARTPDAPSTTSASLKKSPKDLG